MTWLFRMSKAANARPHFIPPISFWHPGVSGAFFHMFALSQVVPASQLHAALPPSGGGNAIGTTAQHQVVIGILAGLASTCFGTTVSAQSHPASALGLHGSRIRTDSPILGTLIRDASERLQTFRALVAAIDANAIVYLRVGTCGRLRACLLHQISVAGPHRVLNIIIDAQHHDLALMGAIGHQLQHALEVLGDVRIRTDVALFAFNKIRRLK